MTEETFRQLCNTYGFAPSRALRELIDCVRVQEIEECARVCEERMTYWHRGDPNIYEDEMCAAAIRARKDKQ